MEVTGKCENCGCPLLESVVVCPVCEEPVAKPDAVRRERNTAASIFAGFTSLIIPGLGQLFQGRLWTALAFFFAAIVNWLMILLFVGLITTPLLHLFAAYEAAAYEC